MNHPSLSDEFWEESDDEKEWQDYLREQQEFDQAIRNAEKNWEPTPEQIQAMYWENEQYYYTQNLGYIP